MSRCEKEYGNTVPGLWVLSQLSGPKASSSYLTIGAEPWFHISSASVLPPGSLAIPLHSLPLFPSLNLAFLS